MPHLLNVWPSVSRQLASSPRVLLLFDYDGTLTPIVARPEIAVLSDEIRRSLSVLAEMDRFVVGVVSGRGLDDLEDLVAKGFIERMEGSFFCGPANEPSYCLTDEGCQQKQRNKV